jgi:hypothetical protein
MRERKASDPPWNRRMVCKVHEQEEGVQSRTTHARECEPVRTTEVEALAERLPLGMLEARAAESASIQKIWGNSQVHLQATGLKSRRLYRVVRRKKTWMGKNELAYGGVKVID